MLDHKGVDYTCLEDLLKAGEWKKADQETARCMCEIMNRQTEGWLREEDIQNLPCTDLHTIDQLWAKYSKGKFCFSVQKKIWQKFGSPTDYGNSINWNQIGDVVGWRIKEEFVAYSELEADLSLPIGYLPGLGMGGPLELALNGMLACFFCRVKACSL